ncbi:hypothetical protein ACG02S_26120 [Roseateles sp. DC23W]|uniref:PEP-CTERM protein-sorting domain-containing protein n=1 Tax=Pelomonas dachongensis TaxID=3299029 RepID=A0ABW7EVA4_9BURK
MSTAASIAIAVVAATAAISHCLWRQRRDRSACAIRPARLLW